MTTERDATRIVRSWLQTDEHESAERVLGIVLDRLDATPQRRPLWRAWRTLTMTGTFKFAAAALAIVVVAGIGLAVYLSRPAVSPVGSPTATPVAASASPALQGRVAYRAMPAGCTQPSDACPIRIWTVNVDGTDVRELAPDLPGEQDIRDWAVAPDGSRLYFWVGDEDRVFSALADGSAREQMCPPMDPCPFPRAKFSPDGTKLAYVRMIDGGKERVIAMLDPVTGPSVDFASTRASVAVSTCDEATGFNTVPNWAPDGSRLVFARTEPRLASGDQCGVIFMLSADGTGLHQLTSSDLAAFEPEWSPDGSTILFAANDKKPSTLESALDLFTIQPDGTAMRALTSDGATAHFPHWTKDGRIVYQHLLVSSMDTCCEFDAVRVVNQDGSNDMEVDSSDLAALTALGCTICPYTPTAPQNSLPFGPLDAYWQPNQ
jgi:hypothetical protein